MPEIAPDVPVETGADTPPRRTSPRRRTFAWVNRDKRRAPVRIDKRFVLGRRVKELVGVFRARLGPDARDLVLLAAVDKAARLTALAEDASARALRADPNVTLDDVVRLERLAEQAIRRLHLDRHDVRQAVPTLSEYLRHRATEPSGELPDAGPPDSQGPAK